MTLSLVSMENTVSQGSTNSRQEKAEELEKLDNRAAAAEPGQLGKGRSGMAPVSYWWAFWVVSLHVQAARLLPTARVSSRLQWQGHSLFLSVLSPLQRSLPQITASGLPGFPPPLLSQTSAPQIHRSPPGAPAWLGSRVTRGHSGYFFHQAFSINIHNMHRALGAGWQYSLRGVENFFPAGLQGAGAIAKAVPVFGGDAAGADGSARNGACTACAAQAAAPAIPGTPSCCASKRCRRKRWVLALQGFQ